MRAHRTGDGVPFCAEGDKLLFYLFRLAVVSIPTVKGNGDVEKGLFELEKATPRPKALVHTHTHTRPPAGNEFTMKVETDPARAKAAACPVISPPHSISFIHYG